MIKSIGIVNFSHFRYISWYQSPKYPGNMPPRCRQHPLPDVYAPDDFQQLEQRLEQRFEQRFNQLLEQFNTLATLVAGDPNNRRPQSRADPILNNEDMFMENPFRDVSLDVGDEEEYGEPLQPRRPQNISNQGYDNRRWEAGLRTDVTEFTGSLQPEEFLD